MSRGRVLTHWDPEDEAFWQREGRAIARRNLWISIPCLLLAFGVWMIWSVVVVYLPGAGFPYTTEELFWLAALPGVSGASFRIFYSFMVPLFGGRRWTAYSTASLLLPALGTGIAIQDPATPFWVMAALAVLCGLGGGNFASSMAHISFFFPKREKGTALGLNAGLGNLGVSVAQFLVPAAVTVAILGGEPLVPESGADRLWLQNAGFVWVPFLVLATLAAWFGMNDIASARASVREQAVIFRRKHNWIMCWLYLGMFGSFIGFSAGFPLLIQTQFPAIDPTRYVFLGPLVGALSRPFGGWLGDKLGGARVTLWSFVAMALAVLAAIAVLERSAEPSFWGFFAAFMVLFLVSGIGNGSTFRMIPLIFLTLHERRAASREARQQGAIEAGKESAAVLGFTSAIGAYGAFFIPSGYGASISVTGEPIAALWMFVVFYLSCVALTWWYYARRGAEVPC